MKRYCCALIILIILVGCSTPRIKTSSDNKYYIEYEEKEPLEWDDFLAEPDMKSPLDANMSATLTVVERMNVWWGYRYLEVHGVMFPYESWIKNGHKTDSKLNYFRTYLTIAELYARKIYTYLDSNNISPNDVIKFTPIFKHYDSLYIKTILQYEKETRNGDDTIQSKIWSDKIKNEMIDYPLNGSHKHAKL